MSKSGFQINEGTYSAIKFAKIDAAASGNNTLVVAVTAKRIRVLGLVMISQGSVNVRLESGASGTALTGQMALVVNSGFTLPFLIR